MKLVGRNNSISWPNKDRTGQIKMKMGYKVLRKPNSLTISVNYLQLTKLSQVPC